MKCKDVHFDYQKQVEQFIEKGVVVENKEEAIRTLKHLSYYKIKEFAAFFRLNSGIYKEGTEFKTILKLFNFDRDLRMEILRCSEKIELSIKAKICYVLGSKYGAFEYLRFSTWCNRNIPKKNLISEEEEFKKKILKKVKIFSDNELVKEFFRENPTEKYLSIWRVGEVLTFGEVLNLFKLMSNKNKVSVVMNYKLSSEDFISYINTIKLMRNLCAHNMAIINFKSKSIPRIHNDFKDIISDPQKIISPILIMIYLIKIIDPHYNFITLYNIINEINSNIPMGIFEINDLKKYLNI